MSKASIVFAAMLLVPTLGISSNEQAPTKPAVTAAQFVKAYVKAMNRADVGSMMKMFSKAPNVTSIGDGSITHGWRSIQTDSKQFVGREGTYKFTVGTVETTPLGTDYVLAVAPVTVQTFGQDEDVEVPAAMTFVLQREGKSWVVIHEHWSSRENDDVGDDPGDEGDGDGFDNFDAPNAPDHDSRANLTGARCTPGMTSRGARTSGSTSAL